MNLFHVFSLHSGPQKLHSSWLGGILGKEVCSECHSPADRSDALNIQVDGKLEDVPLNIALPVAIGIIRLDLLSALGEEDFRDNFFLGKVTDSDGTEIGDFFTFLGKSRQVIRGGPASTYRRCGTCQQILYHPIGKRYLISSFLEGPPLYESQFNQIIATEIIVSRIRNESWDEVKIETLPIVDQARDNLQNVL